MHILKDFNVSGDNQANIEQKLIYKINIQSNSTKSSGNSRASSTEPLVKIPSKISY